MFEEKSAYRVNPPSSRKKYHGSLGQYNDEQQKAGNNFPQVTKFAAYQMSKKT
jgi:hypothetical protein